VDKFGASSFSPLLVFSPTNQGRPWSGCWSKDTTTAVEIHKYRLSPLWCFHQQIRVGLGQVVGQKTQQRRKGYGYFSFSFHQQITTSFGQVVGQKMQQRRKG